MAQLQNQLTKEGKALLEKELDNLVNVERPRVIEELAAARALGDLSENADYTAALRKNEEISNRIDELNAILKNAKIISDTPKNSHVVSFGSVVTVLDLSDDTEATYRIVGAVESNPGEGLVSNVSPLGSAIMGHSVNDVVTVKARIEYQVKILKIDVVK